jgi:tRNA pseudouridine13 synthase
MYKLKSIYEDFVVDEIPCFEKDHLDQKLGKYIYLELSKTNWNTVSAVNELCKTLSILRSYVNFAGTKDKHAVTKQYLSIKTTGNSEQLKQKFPLILASGIDAKFVGFSDQPLSLGSLKGNRFEIILRNLDQKEKISPRKFFVNYFDEQRFSKNNAEIGKAIILKDFKKAAVLVNDIKVKEQLAKCETDYLKALLCLPKKILMLYLHAYQSYLWNETVSRFLQRKLTNLEFETKLLDYSLGKLVLAGDLSISEFEEINIPLIGALPLDNLVSTEIKEIIEKLLIEESVSRFDFIIKQLPNMSPEGGTRPLVASILDLELRERKEDDLNSGFEKQKIEFVLNKGSYATMAIKFLFKN